jgi:hypothetical protein
LLREGGLLVTEAAFCLNKRRLDALWATVVGQISGASGGKHWLLKWISL